MEFVEKLVAEREGEEESEKKVNAMAADEVKEVAEKLADVGLGTRRAALGIANAAPSMRVGWHARAIWQEEENEGVEPISCAYVFSSLVGWLVVRVVPSLRNNNTIGLSSHRDPFFRIFNLFYRFSETTW